MHLHKWKYLAPAAIGKKMAPERICVRCEAHHYRIRSHGEWTPWIEHPSWRMHVQPPTVQNGYPPVPPGSGQTDEFHGEKKQVILL